MRYRADARGVVHVTPFHKDPVIPTVASCASHHRGCLIMVMGPDLEGPTCLWCILRPID